MSLFWKASVNELAGEDWESKMNVATAEPIVEYGGTSESARARLVDTVKCHGPKWRRVYDGR